VIIRPATHEDVATLVELIGDLATYVADDGGNVLGMTIYFRNYSTWTGRLGLYLEDFYVRPEARGRGVGRALVAQLVDEARAHGYARIDWSVLDWNQSAIRFSQSLGAVPMEGWTGYRLSGEALEILGALNDGEE